MTIGTLAVLSGITYLYSILSAPFTLRTLFFPTGDELGTFQGAVQEFLKWDQIFFAASSILWIAYMFADLNDAEMVAPNWLIILGILSTVSLAFGTGAATALGWLWREEILVSRVSRKEKEKASTEEKMRADTDVGTEKGPALGYVPILM